MEYEPWVQEWQHQNKMLRRQSRLPVCDGCGEPICSETYVYLAGCRYCRDCIRANTFLTEQDRR